MSYPFRDVFRKAHYFGCSYTYGAGLKDKFKERYSFHLSKMFNTPERNYAVPGGNDYLSLYSLLRLQRSGYITDEDLVVFQWTQPHRHPIPIATEKQEFGEDGGNEFNTTDTLYRYPFLQMHNLNKLNRDQKYFLQNYVGFINADAHYQFNNQVFKELLEGWANLNNLNLIQFMSHNFYEDIPDRPSWTSDVMAQFLEHNNFTSDLPCGHPSAEGHEAWASHLFYKHVQRFRSPLL